MGTYFLSVFTTCMLLFFTVCESKIYDCFLFYNELELLDVRLRELYEIVDKFVLVESVETFRGNLKPLHYQQNKERYAQYADKIIHVVLENRQKTNNPWDRETFQRNQITRGLKSAERSDIILISDADELIRSSAIERIKQAIYSAKQNPVVCEQTMYRYFLNAHEPSTPWAGTVAVTLGKLRYNSPDTLRMKRNNGASTYFYPLIPHAGWHFTSLGGLDRFIKKIESFSHHESDNAEIKSEKFMTRTLNESCIRVPIDESYPKYIIENIEAFKNAGFLY